MKYFPILENKNCLFPHQGEVEGLLKFQSHFDNFEDNKQFQPTIWPKLIETFKFKRSIFLGDFTKALEKFKQHNEYI